MKKAKDQFLQNYYKVIAKLEEHNLMFKDVNKIVGLTKPKVLYYVDKELKLSGKETSRKKHERHLFSIVDLFGLALVDELRRICIQTKVCRLLFRAFKKSLFEEDVYQRFSLIQELSDSKSMILLIDAAVIEHGNVPVLSESLQDKVYGNLKEIERPSIIIPLNPIYRSVVRQIKRDDFQVKLVKNVRGREKVLYYVDGKEIDIVQRVKVGDTTIRWLSP